MQTENITEYQLLRDEMATVKDCITKYIGYVLTGSGAAIYGMARMGQIPTNDSALAVTSVALSVILNSVLLILYYKFYSHNRFAGYCKLLNHERYDIQKEGTSFLSWELVLERLRFSEISPASLLNLVKNIKMKELGEAELTFLLSKYTGRNPFVDHEKFKKGLPILWKAIFGKIETRSWGFPPIVVALFCILSFSFYIFGLISFLGAIKISNIFSNLNSIITISFLSILLIIQLWLWNIFVGKLFSLMDGSCTVDGFFWRFLPVRVAFLNTYNIEPEYLFVKERLSELIKELGQT
jgi:hypothetical protein